MTAKIKLFRILQLDFHKKILKNIHLKILT
ncbi:MAG: hypothetical protein RL344_402 [Pseudomonadota bacterium]|jgi:hypothetical protein